MQPDRPLGSEPVSQERPRSFKDVAWRPSYKTSSLRSDERTVDILHDFYIPILGIAVEYDRVAGFFRSSSLAAASQGFSAFVSSNGRMRLVVGADLDPADVAAILEGDRARLEKGLLKELEGEENWPKEVDRGVRLLAFMVAKGHLEVKVAFRVHSRTGRPIPIESMEDGYVHEKWAVFRDGKGNRIYISGSLNESRTALALNAENIDVHCEWWNELERQRVDEAEKDFEAVWTDRSPYLRVMPLPEAVKRRLIRFSEGISVPYEVDGTTAFEPEVEPPSALERLKFAMIKDGPLLPGGRFVGMETAPVRPWPHQEIVARRLVETWPFSWLLCDEVGLGKTIEAGLAIRSLYLSGLAKRVLISAPASLTRQWQREMASKFLLPFARAVTGPRSQHKYIFPDERVRESSSLYSPNLCIISTGLLAHRNREKELKAALGFDITLVDEAHYARRQNPAAPDNRRTSPRFGRLYRAIKDELRQRSRCLWLATATPMQLDWIEVYDLIRLTNRIGAFGDDPTLVWGYYDILGKLSRKEELHRLEWEFLRKVLRSIEYHDPLLKRFIEEAVMDGQIRIPARRLLEHGKIPRGRDRENITRLIFAAAPLSRVMLRHTRALLEIYKKKGRLKAGLAKREILPMPAIVFTSEEKRAYDKLEEFCSGLSRQIAGGKAGRGAHKSLKFLLSLFRLRFASSLFAIKETIKRRLERVEATLLVHQEMGREVEAVEDITYDLFDEEDFDKKVLSALLKNRSRADLEWEKRHLRRLLEILEGIHSRPSKVQTLLDILEKRRRKGGRFRQTVIFTRFYDTLTDIVSHLLPVNPAISIGTYSGRGGQYVDVATGRLKNATREEVKQRFLQGAIDILICTDAAAEGLNLQTADLLINFDLPWNPMKVEQRIGRIDRIGQRHEKVYVLNLCYAGSVEEIVYGRLLERLSQAWQVVGAQQISMLPVYEEDFERLANGSLSEKQLERIARERIERLKEQRAAMEVPSEELYEIYTRLSSQKKKEKLPVDLEAIWEALCTSRYLAGLGCKVSQDGKFITIRGIDGVPDGALLTSDRELFEMGIPGSDSPVHFASYGDPVFEAILRQIGSFGLPGSIKKISVPIKEINTKIVAYQVATKENDKVSVKLLTALSDLEALEIMDDYQIPGKEAEKHLERLEDISIQEFMEVLAARQVEEANIKASTAQHVLSMVSGLALLNDLDAEESEGFWQAVNTIDKRLRKESTFSMSNLWSEPLRPFLGEFLFDLTIPAIGEWARLEAPALLGMSALDSSCRVASSIHRKRAEITIGEVLDRLERRARQAAVLPRA